MAKRHKLWAVAGLLVGRYGAEAVERARRNAARAARDGDTDSQAIWSDVAGVLHKKSLGNGAAASAEREG